MLAARFFPPYVLTLHLSGPQIVPTITYVVDRTRPGCSVADVLRLERLVLDKLQWQLRLVTPLSFLQSLHCLLVSACPGLLSEHPQQLSRHRQLLGLTERLLQLVTDCRSLGVPPACLAAALICCELQRCGVETAPFVEAAHRLIKVGLSPGDSGNGLELEK